MVHRPRIPDALEEEMEEEKEGEPLYKRKGYSSKTHFVIEAVREKIEREKKDDLWSAEF